MTAPWPIEAGQNAAVFAVEPVPQPEWDDVIQEAIAVNCPQRRKPVWFEGHRAGD
ncbi:MAG: hypothetical protein RIQ93_719 [Verrucomicrobiota bacterium]|jgi:hypothetical protein